MSYLTSLERRQLREREMVVSGKTVTVWETGDTSGPAIVLLHGLRGSYEGLAPLALALGPQRVIMPVLPGYSGSEELSEAHSITAYSRWLNQLIALLPDTRMVVGHSFGAAVVAQWAKIFPQTDRLIVLVNPVMNQLWLQQVGQRAYSAVIKSAPKLVRQVLLNSKTLNKLESRWLTVSREPKLRHSIVQARLAERSLYMQSVAVQNISSIRKSPIKENLAKITAPVLVVGAANDRLTTGPQLAVAVKLMPNVTITTINKAGHLAPIEATTELAGILTNWFNQKATP